MNDRSQDPRIIDFIKQSLIIRPSLNVKTNEPYQDYPQPRKHLPFLIASFFLIIIGQLFFELSLSSSPIFGILLFIGGSVIAIHSFRILGEETDIVETEFTHERAPVYWERLVPSILLAVFSFFLFRNNGLNSLSFLAWALSIGLSFGAFWENKRDNFINGGEQTPIEKGLFNHTIFKDRMFLMAFVFVIVAVLFFQIQAVRHFPPELVSQQVEIYQTVQEVRDSARPLIFTRNVVIEPLLYYWSAFISMFSGKALTLAALQTPILIANMIGLFYLFRLGNLLFNKWVGFLSVLLMGVGFWPIIQSYAMTGDGLALPMMIISAYYLFSGLSLGKRTDFLLHGLFIGLGIMSNKICLILPVFSLLTFIIWAIFIKRKGAWLSILKHIGLVLLSLLLTVIPLLAVISVNPDAYFPAILSRISSHEIAIEGNPILIFIKNFFSSFGILNVLNRNSWVDGIPNRPALDIITASFFIFGLVYSSFRFIREKSWKYPAIILSLFVFLIPTAMSIAFPLENPSLTRAIGVSLPAMIISAFGMVAFVQAFEFRSKQHTTILVLIMLLPMLFQNYTLAQHRYLDHYRQNAGNTKEMAELITRFKQENKENAHVWLVEHPHWVDVRAIGIHGGFSVENVSIGLEELEKTVTLSGTKLFILNLEGQDALAQLRMIYPNGVESLFQSRIKDKDFRLFMVHEN